MINVELLGKTMQHIIDNPCSHNQYIWMDSCGTTACFAGWACLLSGAQQMCSGELRSDMWFQANGTVISVPNLATELLGLSEDEAAELFDLKNTIDDLQRIVKELINESQP